MQDKPESHWQRTAPDHGAGDSQLTDTHTTGRDLRHAQEAMLTEHFTTAMATAPHLTQPCREDCTTENTITAPILQTT